ncbi:hypothetical protein MSAN_01807300 [Mycena sanguinolenta]|uniref:Uncharacterized protein n=1 Tax=Mycena sanguinolenta TaxID=230812 RepID=A0A8H6XRH2_9AGAR|nr:hypothetical protein MSAN_01807300 [Mycena sanguinolenta]
MFSKLLAFGLGALAVVRAAPSLSFQTQYLSCSVNLDGSVATVKSFDALEPGKYTIWNDGLHPPGPLYAYSPDSLLMAGPASVSPTIWSITPSGNPGSNQYTITASNIGTKVSKGMIVSTTGQSDSFTISPAGEGRFTIQVPNEDEVWSVYSAGVASASNVFLQPEMGEIDSRWTFVAV